MEDDCAGHDVYHDVYYDVCFANFYRGITVKNGHEYPQPT